tara:strand:- start:414 stop:629 length:216 start_codon:yes stop_codon:yes gene_type:complete
MKNAITSLNGWISVITGLLLQLIILGAVIGVLFGDQFNVIAGIGQTMELIGDKGLGGLVALVLIATWYKKS